MQLMQDLRAKEPRTPELDDMIAMTLAELGPCGGSGHVGRDAIAAAERAGRTDVVRRMTENLLRYEAADHAARREETRTPLCFRKSAA
jgi:hypothetical protein